MKQVKQVKQTSKLQKNDCLIKLEAIPSLPNNQQCNENLSQKLLLKHQKTMKNLSKRFKLRNIDEWKQIRPSTLIKTVKGKELYEYYKKDMQHLLTTVYPTHEWNFSDLYVNKTTYFKNFQNQRQFMNDLFKIFNFTSLDDWLLVSKKRIIKYGGRSLLSYYSYNFPELLVSIYPKHEWRFNENVLSEEMQFATLLHIYSKLKLTSISDLLLVTKSQYYHYKDGKKLLHFIYFDNKLKMLQTIFPNYPWTSILHHEQNEQHKEQNNDIQHHHHHQHHHQHHHHHHNVNKEKKIKNVNNDNQDVHHENENEKNNNNNDKMERSKKVKKEKLKKKENSNLINNHLTHHHHHHNNHNIDNKEDINNKKNDKMNDLNAEIIAKLQKQMKYKRIKENLGLQSKLLTKIYHNLKLQSFDDFITVSHSQLKKYGATPLLEHYSNNLFKLLCSIFPNFPWRYVILEKEKPKKFKKKRNTLLRQQFTYFKFFQKEDLRSSISNQREYMNYLYDLFQFTSLNDWLKIRKSALLSSANARILLQLYDYNLHNLLSTIYPNHDWNNLNSKFRVSSLHSLDFLRMKIRFLIHHYTIRQQKDWYRLNGYIEGIHLFDSLVSLYPSIRWRKQDFLVRSKKTTQRLLYSFLFQLFYRFLLFEDYKHPSIRYMRIYPLEFDIYIPSIELAFEYQGEQHYNDLPSGFNTHHTYQVLDNMKVKFAKMNSISLIYIPYWWNLTLPSLYSTIQSSLSYPTI